MRLLIQSDDYGISKAQALGAIEAIRNGIIRNLGMFTNMECREQCAKLIDEYRKDISLGIDLNISTGSPLSDIKRIPSIVKDDCKFYSSKELAKQNINYKEVYIEFKAQIDEFVRLFGVLPSYIHNHAYFSNGIMEVTRKLSKEYNIMYSFDYCSSNNFYIPTNDWYKLMDEIDQSEINVSDFLIKDEMNLLMHDNVWLVCHCGYIDAELLKLSSYNIIRCKDLEMATNNDVKEWIKINNIELIKY